MGRPYDFSLAENICFQVSNLANQTILQAFFSTKNVFTSQQKRSSLFEKLIFTNSCEAADTLRNIFYNNTLKPSHHNIFAK